MARWLWIALAIGCTGKDDDAADGDGAGETDGTTVTANAECRAVDPTAPVVPLLPAQMVELEGHPVFYGMPDGHVTGIILHFHGSGGMASDVNGPEEQAVINQLVPFGWGFVSAESEDQEPGHEWNTSHEADNPDMARVKRALEHIASITTLEADTPIVGQGFSNGGQAVSAFRDIYKKDLEIVAGSFHNTSAWGIEGVPTIFFAAENDPKATPADLESAHEDVLATGELSEYHFQPEQTLTAAMLQRNEEIDAEEAAVLFADMVAAGLVAEDGTRLATGDGNQLDKTLNNWGDRSEAPGAARASDMAHSIWALHRFNGYQAQAECEFLTGIVN